MGGEVDRVGQVYPVPNQNQQDVFPGYPVIVSPQPAYSTVTTTPQQYAQQVLGQQQSQQLSQRPLKERSINEKGQMFFNYLETCEAIVERALGVIEYFFFGKNPAGLARISMGVGQVVIGGFASGFFKIADSHLNTKQLADRSWHQVTHGFSNIGRGIVANLLCGNVLLFIRDFGLKKRQCYPGENYFKNRNVTAH